MKRRRIEPIYANTYQRLRRRSRWLRFFMMLLIVLVIVGGWLTYQHYRNQQLSNFPVRGVSLDQDNGFVDFQQLQHQNFQFAYLRATSGATYTDDQFQSSYDRALGSNLEIGIYHVYSYSTTPAAQFANFKSEVGNRLGKLPIAIQLTTYGDYNTSTLKQADTQKRLKTFIQLLTQHYHRSTVLWCNASVWQALSTSKLSMQTQWLADGSLAKQPNSIRFIEYAPQGKIRQSGQSQTVPISVFNGSQRQWNAWVTK